jgi:citrate lyase beta subunit
MTQPVHVIYGGAHLFRSGICRKLGALALRSIEEHAPDAARFAEVLELRPELAETVYSRVIEKLKTEPVEDFRVDFEDGYGVRSNAEEDAAAVAAAEQVVAAELPRFFGIRIKPLTGASKARGLRTLDLFLSGLKGNIPPNFLVTLPKVSTTAEVCTLREALAPFPTIRMELMIETPQALRALPELIEAAEGRCIAAHFGAYDYMASLGITAARQNLLHPACDFARSTMQVQLAGTGVWVSDGGTNILPVPPSVHRGWKLHYDAVRHAFDCGFYQGWDLHPAQLPARFAAVFASVLEGVEAASERLKNFIAHSERATLTGGVFDDAATGRGLVLYFMRGVACGAILESEIPSLTGLTMGDLRLWLTRAATASGEPV